MKISQTKERRKEMEEWSYEALDWFWKKVHRWQRRTLHDKILIMITVMAVIVVLTGMCMIDSGNWVQILIAIIVGCSWLLLFARANERD